MNKAEFIDKFSDALGSDYKKSEVTKFVDAFLKTVMVSLKEEEVVRFIGFGTFKAKHAASRKVTTPKGNTVSVPAQWQVRFSAGENFKKELND